jgi:hypothetical protein
MVYIYNNIIDLLNFMMTIKQHEDRCELNNNNYANYCHVSNKIKNKLHFGTVVIIILVSIITMVISNTIIMLPVVSLAQVNSIPINPFETRGVPPQIVMEYEGKEYPGKLVRYITNISTSNSTGGSSQSLGGGTLTSASPDNITSPLPAQIIPLKKNSSINFIIKGNNNNTPTKAQPNTMSVTAYNIKGMPVKLLNTTQQVGAKNIVVVNLDKGQYILLSVATWLPQKGSDNNNNKNTNTIIGFVSYSYRINVVS